MATNAQRHHLLQLMDLFVHYEPQIHYLQARPMHNIHYSEQQIHTLLSHGRSLSMDCSEGVTCLAKWAGLKDPNGRHYNGTGNTESLFANLPHYTDANDARIGALVDFNHPDHVCMVHTPGKDPLLWSHGQERGPFLIRLSEERKYHPGPITFLSIVHL